MILVQEKAPIAYLGRIMGFVRFGLMSAGVLPLLAAPALAEAFGVQAVLFAASCIIALVGAVFFLVRSSVPARGRRSLSDGEIWECARIGRAAGRPGRSLQGRHL